MASNCLQTLSGLLYDECGGNIAGIARVYIGQRADINDASVVAETSTMTITGFAMADGAKVYQYDFAEETGSLTSTLTRANGNKYWTNDINLVFNKLEARKHVEIEALAAGRLFVIVEDNNGLFHFVGLSRYATVNAGTAETGTAIDDANQYTTTISAREKTLPYFIAKSLFESYISTPAS